jgi:hypothetical protein
MYDFCHFIFFFFSCCDTCITSTEFLLLFYVQNKRISEDVWIVRGCTSPLHVSIYILGFNKMWTCRLIATFGRNILPQVVTLKMDSECSMDYVKLNLFYSKQTLCHTRCRPTHVYGENYDLQKYCENGVSMFLRNTGAASPQGIITQKCSSVNCNAVWLPHLVQIYFLSEYFDVIIFAVINKWSLKGNKLWFEIKIFHYKRASENVDSNLTLWSRNVTICCNSQLLCIL